MGLPGCLFVCHLILLLMCFLFNNPECCWLCSELSISQLEVSVFQSKPKYISVSFYLDIMSNGLHCVKEIIVFYLSICFFYYLVKLIIFTRSSRIYCIFFLEGVFKGIYLKKRNFTLSYVVSEI